MIFKIAATDFNAVKRPEKTFAADSIVSRSVLYFANSPVISIHLVCTLLRNELAAKTRLSNPITNLAV